MSRMSDCILCPRECHADRTAGERGFCGMTDRMKIARADLHMWEEPCISGERGSGTVFFTGCPLRCAFCQNHEIACDRMGWELSAQELSDIFFRLKEKGAANINLVTPGHFAEPVADALKEARNHGLDLPVICNTGGYEKKETLRLWEGLVDVYLPDFKSMDPRLAEKYSHAPDYPEAAKEALKEMVRQVGACEFNEEGFIKKGVIVRHLILPGHTRDSKDVLRYLFEAYGHTIYLSIMNQYTPMKWMGEDPDLSRKVTRREYQKVIDYALKLGVENGFIQEGETASESFIPPFSGERPW